MTTGASAGAASAAAAAGAIAQAIRASGAIVRVEPRDFLGILERSEQPLVVEAVSGLLSTSYRYLTSYKGLVFFSRSRRELELPPGVERVQARKIWIP